jgi:hypothetical protein
MSVLHIFNHRSFYLVHKDKLDFRPIAPGLIALLKNRVYFVRVNALSYSMFDALRVLYSSFSKYLLSETLRFGVNTFDTLVFYLHLKY